MKKKEKTVQIYAWWDISDPLLIGTMKIEWDHGKERFGFAYSEEWLNYPDRFSISQELGLYPGWQFSESTAGCGVFSDSVPDRWGRTLLRRHENLTARAEQRPPRKLQESDFLLGVEDQTRMGAFRFSEDGGKTFINSRTDDQEVPPLTRLRELEEASREFELEANDSSLRLLLQPGSSLGGARPKANVMDENRRLWIAKFPSRRDETDVGAWEKTMIDLAGLCKIQVPEVSLRHFSETGSTFLSRRFDRDGETRIHFSSAMSLLGKKDGDTEDCGYLDLVDFLRQSGSRPKEDTLELFARIVFSAAVSNTDDHLRNHGFLLRKGGWVLSPMYDVNPNPYRGHEVSESAIDITPGYRKHSVDNLLEFAEYADIGHEMAVQIIKDVFQIVLCHWRETALKNGIRKSEIENMASAFEKPDLQHEVEQL